MNTGFQLFQLQEIDSAIDFANRRSSEIDNLLLNDDLIRKAMNNLKNCEKEYDIHKQSFDALNNEIQSRKIKKTQSESSLYGGSISNPKELQDLQKEITSLAAFITKADEELMEKLISLEVTEAAVEEAKQALKKVQSDFATRKSLLIGEKKQLANAIVSQKEKKNSVLTLIDKETIEIYSALRNAKDGVAVARLMDSSCSSCGASLTARQCQQTRATTMLFFCPNCGRVLYGS